MASAASASKRDEKPTMPRSGARPDGSKIGVIATRGEARAALPLR
jgi:hypothetical protein